MCNGTEGLHSGTPAESAVQTETAGVSCTGGPTNTCQQTRAQLTQERGRLGEVGRDDGCQREQAALHRVGNRARGQRVAARGHQHGVDDQTPHAVPSDLIRNSFHNLFRENPLVGNCAARAVDHTCRLARFSIAKGRHCFAACRSPYGLREAFVASNMAFIQFTSKLKKMQTI